MKMMKVLRLWNPKWSEMRSDSAAMYVSLRMHFEQRLKPKRPFTKSDLAMSPSIV